MTKSRAGEGIKSHAHIEELFFKVSPKLLGPLGLEQLQDPALAILELIKNSWDADATNVKVKIESNKRIVVEDDGSGMSERDFKDRWLVIGASYKRDDRKSKKKRPFIGEKGLGRLATFALGDTIRIDSAVPAGAGSSASFGVTIEWKKLLAAESLDQYKIRTHKSNWRRGTRIEVRNLSSEWTKEQTNYLIAHAEFLTAIPGAKFTIQIAVDSEQIELEGPETQIARLAEAELEMIVGSDGVPELQSCIVEGTDYAGKIGFRAMKERELDPSIAGLRLKLNFFKRDEFEKALTRELQRTLVRDVMDRYQGVRIFRNGINVPPYGIGGDDWAKLEKQRTSTGGPTMTPGNSQLFGELHLASEKHPQFTVTAGRSGFSDQNAVERLARYVRWAVRALATARRAKVLGIKRGEVPGRTDLEASNQTPEKPSEVIRRAMETVSSHEEVMDSPALKRAVSEASKVVLATLESNDLSLRLYAQLASTGIAATSFAHELRAEFDVITEAVGEISRSKARIDKELINLLSRAWGRVKSFATIFQVVPVKLRRRPRKMSSSEMSESARAILDLATPQKISTKFIGSYSPIRIVPAEFDSILVNLVSNAIKAINESKNRNSGQILVSLTEQGMDLILKVADNGVGISEKIKKTMYEPLEGTFAEGTGMGLPIVRFLASKYDGTVELVERPPKAYSTEFQVRLKEIVEIEK